MDATSPKADRTVWTIGHSSHPLDTFLDLLAQHQIALLADVRSHPYSRHAPQFNRQGIQRPLRARAVGYLFLGDLLGGRAEGKQFYDEQGHVLYDRVARSPEFQRGIQRLLDPIQSSRVALMCGEEDPADCHRRLLIGRVLRARGIDVIHIRGDGTIQSEEELAAQERFRKTKGQLTLFDMGEPDEWKSTQSVLPRRAPRSFSRPSNEPE